MLRFDVALQALKRRMAAKPGKAPSAQEPDRPGGILIPFPLRKLPAPAVAGAKRRAPG